jgi:DNA-binding IscR family transcriptional regulator
VLSKLSKAGLIVTKRGKSGASVLARPPRRITLLDIYRANAAPPAFAIHSYPVEKRCPVSCNLKECMSGVLSQAQYSLERSLAKITLANLVGQIRERRIDFLLIVMVQSKRTIHRKNEGNVDDQRRYSDEFTSCLE